MVFVDIISRDENVYISKEALRPLSPSSLDIHYLKSTNNFSGFFLSFIETSIIISDITDLPF